MIKVRLDLAYDQHRVDISLLRSDISCPKDTTLSRKHPYLLTAGSQSELVLAYFHSWKKIVRNVEICWYHREKYVTFEVILNVVCQKTSD